MVAGPRASTLLVFSALVGNLAHSAALAHLPYPALAALTLACTAMLGSGMLQFFYGLFRLGKLVNYVPLPVLAGFVNGSALLIILSQVWAATGIAAQKSVWALWTHVGELRPATLLLALSTAASVILLPRLTRRVPPLLLAFVVGTAVYHFLALLGFGVDLGGTLPPPPEHFALGFIGTQALALLAGPGGDDLLRPIALAAMSMSILSSLDSLLATAATDGIAMRRSNASRQLMAEGLGNLLAGMFSMSLGAGSLTRSQAALKGGMASAAAPIAIALITLLITVALGPLIGRLPQAVMAGLLIAQGIDLFDKWTLARLRRLFSRAGGPAARSDLLVVAAVVATALLADLGTAVGMGILLSLLSFVMQMARSPIRRCYPATALIPHIYGDIVRCNFIEQHGMHITVIEIEGALFFGTASELEARVDALASEGVVHVVLDLRRVKHIDATGARALERIDHKLSLRGGMLAVSHVERERRQGHQRFTADDKRRLSTFRRNWVKLASLGTISALGEARFLTDSDSAVALCEKHLASKLSSATKHDALPLIPSLLTHIFDRPMLRRLRRYWERISYAPGDAAFSQGSAPDGVFFVLSGRVEVLIDLPGTDRKRKVQSLTPGSVFGEMALIDLKPRSASIVAKEPTQCYWVSSGNFERLKHEQPDIAFALLTDVAIIFAQRLRATNTMLAEMEA